MYDNPRVFPSMAHERYAIVGDVHGNWEALNAVLQDAASQNVTSYACVGDIVGYNANPIECLERLRGLNCPCIRGNHDHYCSHNEDLGSFHPLAAAVIDWTRKKLSEQQRAWLKNLRYKRAVAGFMIVHATLDLPDQWGYVFDDLDAMNHFSYQVTPVCFHGHTHVPIAFRYGSRIKTMQLDRMKIERGEKYFINVGSVGQPRDGNPFASYVIYDMQEREVELRRIEYDIETAQRKIINAGLPDCLAERLALGK
jgi:diadenosine tetraphosphatase ApaH/serine/threonine PP2A family protein phosphatase